MDPIKSIFVVAICGVAFVALFFLIVVQGLLYLFTLLRENIACADAEQELRNRWQKTRKHLPSLDRTRSLARNELNLISDIDLRTLQGYLLYLLTYQQAESSLVAGVFETEEGQKLSQVWMRFYWRDGWWVLWYDKKHRRKKHPFRAFPEAWISSETQNIGRIIAMRTFSYQTIAKYFK